MAFKKIGETVKVPESEIESTLKRIDEAHASACPFREGDTVEFTDIQLGLSKWQRVDANGSLINDGKKNTGEYPVLMGGKIHRNGTTIPVAEVALSFFISRRGIYCDANGVFHSSVALCPEGTSTLEAYHEVLKRKTDKSVTFTYTLVKYRLSGDTEKRLHGLNA